MVRKQSASVAVTRADLNGALTEIDWHQPLSGGLTTPELPELIVSPTDDRSCFGKSAPIRRADGELYDASRQRHGSGIRSTCRISALASAKLTGTIVTPAIDFAVHQHARVTKPEPDLFRLLARQRSPTALHAPS